MTYKAPDGQAAFIRAALAMPPGTRWVVPIGRRLGKSVMTLGAIWSAGLGRSHRCRRGRTWWKS